MTRSLIASAAAAAVAGSALVLAPMTTAPASAATSVKVKDNKRGKVLRDRVAKIAKAQNGDNYVLGATGPGAFDCSGLVVYSYRKATGVTLPRTSYMQRDQLMSVKKRDRRVGDIVVLHNGGHVGIYVGGNKIIHASNPTRGVLLSKITGYYGNQVDGYRRVIRAR